MYTIKDLVEPLTPSQISSFGDVEPATVGHYVQTGFAPGLHPVTSATKLVGAAVTVRIERADCTALHHVADVVQPGHVVVIDMAQDVNRAAVGAMVAFALAQRGASGVVIDGMATDRADLEATGMPVFARGLNVMTTSVTGAGGEVGGSVSVGDSTVNPGDIVLGDENGVVFLPAEQMTLRLNDFLAAQALEPPARDRLRAGEPFSHIFGAAAHLQGALRA